MDLSVSTGGVFCDERGKFRPGATASLAGGGTTGGPQRGGGVAVAFDRLLAEDRRAERVPKILRRPIVDDGVNAGVEVRQTGAQHVDGIEPDGALRRSEEVDEQQDEVDRQPQKSKDDNHQDQKTTDLALAVGRTRLLL